ncbi:MAG: TIGR03084 family protein [Sphingomonadales bacterium]|nr:MAG: TIGR03084 family protein [Sphingomonadales bacterium]
MKQLGQDFLAESSALHALVAPLDDAGLKQETAFKAWTIERVVQHLHVWNMAALMSLKGDGSFEAYYAQLEDRRRSGGTMGSFEREWLKGLSGRDLVSAWRDGFAETAERFAQAEPSARVKWAGPDMSARSSITARLMETWAHGQEVYDALGVVRKNGDRIRNIVVLGNNTYGWTFKVRGEAAPEPRPHLRLTAPSGEVWLYNEASESELIEGLAEEFCQVVTQTRNIGDTRLKVVGANAGNWMSKAQCFAGDPETPPPVGSRTTAANV